MSVISQIGNVGSGWHPLIRQLHEELEAMSPGYETAQVKEKFGGLRVYLSSALTDPMREAVRRAEQQAWVTCERCGASGASIDEQFMWRLTLCDPCKELRMTCRGPRFWNVEGTGDGAQDNTG